MLFWVGCGCVVIFLLPLLHLLEWDFQVEASEGGIGYTLLLIRQGDNCPHSREKCEDSVSFGEIFQTVNASFSVVVLAVPQKFQNIYKCI